MTLAAALEPPVAKTPSEKEPTENVRLPRSIVDKARVVVANRKRGGNRISLTDYLAAIVRDPVEADHAEFEPPPAKKKPKGEG